jgi:hypothetical protein
VRLEHTRGTVEQLQLRFGVDRRQASEWFDQAGVDRDLLELPAAMLPLPLPPARRAGDTPASQSAAGRTFLETGNV